MALVRGPRIVRNGLVLHLDAAQRTSCTGQPVTNLLTYTNTFASPWSGYCGPTSNITFNTTDITDPIGTNTAIKVVRGSNVICNSTEAWGLLYGPDSPIITSGGTYTTSFYARGAVGGETLDFGVNDGFMTYSQSLTTTWTRYSVSFGNVTDTSRGFQFRNTTGNCTYYVWGPQTQEGAYVGPYAASGETNGTANLTWIDLTSNKNNGAQTNNPAFISSNGGSILFDGTNDYVAIPNSTSLQVADTFTVSAWIKASNLSARYGIFSTRANNTTGCWQFEVGTGSGGTGRILITGIGTFIAESSNNVISANQWYHISVVKVNNATQGATLYVNGVAISNALTTAYTISNNSDEKRIAIGTASSQYFPGNIAMVSLYNRALSASEILQNFNTTKGRFNL